MKSLFKKFSYHLLLFSVLIQVTLPVHAQLRGWGDDLDTIADGTQSCMVDNVPTLKCFEVVAGNLLFMANGLVLIVLFVMFLIGSFKYLTSLGSPEKIQEAVGTLKWAIIGLIVYVSAYMILKTIDMLFLGNQGLIFQFKIGD